MVRTPSFLMTHWSHFVALDIERLGNPGWNWNSFKRALTSVEGHVFFRRSIAHDAILTSWAISFIEPPEDIVERFGLLPDEWKFGRDGLYL